MTRAREASFQGPATTILLCWMLLCGPVNVEAEGLYFSSGASIEACDLDGSNRRPLVGFSGGDNSFVDMTVEPLSQAVWWALYESASDEIVFYRTSPKSKLPEEVLRKSGGNDFRAFAVDGVAGKIYWARTGDTDAIQRADLDGSHVETLVSPIGVGLFALHVYPEYDEMYWTSTTPYNERGTIHRSTLDGEAADSLVTGQGWPSGISIDRRAGKIYWSDRFWHTVNRANLVDGSDVEPIVEAIGNPMGVAVDPEGGRLYWNDTKARKLQWSDLDGNNQTDLFVVASPSKLAILPSPQVNVEETSWSDVRERFR